jgi:RHS repeat-associated protein
MIAKAYNSQNYRFAYNGLEKDDEIKGSGNSYDFGLRIYDPRLGKFLSIDPLASDFPYWGPYNYAANSPILVIDDGGGNPILVWAGKGALGGVIDASIQFVINLAIYNGDADQAFKNIDWLQAGKTAVESALPWSPPGGKWGQGAVVAAGDVAFNVARMKYSGMSAREATEKIALDFIVGYLSYTGAKFGGEKLAKAMPQLATWLVKKGLQPTLVKQLTGRWATRAANDNKSLTSTIANYLDDTFGDGTVKDVMKTIKGADGKPFGDIDVELSNINIEVKSGGAKFDDIMADAANAAKEGKSYVLFAT